MTASLENNGSLAETIILQYKAGDSAGIATYQKVCKTIDNIDKWLPEGVVQFLEQFMTIGHLLDGKCKMLVEKLADISWNVVPVQIRPRFVRLLQDLAVHHVCHTEALLCCFIVNLFPKVRPVASKGDKLNDEGLNTQPTFEFLLDEQEQDSIYELAHGAIKFVLRCFPMTVRLLEKAIRRNFPHFNAPSLRYHGFIRNVFFIHHYAVDIRGELWRLLLENLVHLDSVVSKGVVSKVQDKDTGDRLDIFLMDEENEQLNDTVAAELEERKEKLDICLCYILSYIAKAHNCAIPPDIDLLVNWLGGRNSRDGLYLNLRTAFEAHVLLAPGLKSVPFVLFYLLSLDQKYVNNFAEWLWSFIISPSQSPSDWKKAHAAACYLGSLLSRAKFVEFKTSFVWMERLVKWCTHYVNETVGGSAGATAGTLRHGSFYAVCQALLVTFTFRYREMMNGDELEIVRRWGLGHIIHSSLQPLRYINHTIALNFATISRSLQLVYCSHILPQSLDEVNAPFEPFFPFEYYFLSRSATFIRDLTLRFSPLVEESGEGRWRYASGHSNSVSFHGSFDPDSLDFLEDVKRDKDIISDDRRGIWPLIRSPHFDYSLSKLSSSPLATGFITSSSMMDTT